MAPQVRLPRKASSTTLSRGAKPVREGNIARMSAGLFALTTALMSLAWMPAAPQMDALSNLWKSRWPMRPVEAVIVGRAQRTRAASR